MGKIALFLVILGMVGLVSSYSQAQNASSDRELNRDERTLKVNPTNIKGKPADLDGDGIPDSRDLDIDGDGVNNWQDPFPRNASESADTDGDGVGDSADPDSDGDGFSNDEEKLAGTNPHNKDSFPDTTGPVLRVIELAKISTERLIPIRGMAFDSGMGMKKIQVVNEDGDVFSGFFEYSTHFNVEVRLSVGHNELEVLAFDKANNVTRRLVNITYQP